MDEPSSPTTPPTTSTWEVARVFLRLGTTAFGGPAAHVAMMEDEFVRRRRWLTHAEFLDMLGAVNLIPGPNSTQMAIYVGYRRAGWKGLVLAGTCFILPAMAIVTALAWAYLRFQQLPQATGLLYGIKPVVIAVIVQALWGLGRRAITSWWSAAVAAAAMAAAVLGLDPLSLVLAAGLVVALAHGIRVARGRSWRSLLALTLAVGGIVALIHLAPAIQAASPDEGAHPCGLGPLFVYFLKIGSVLYGSGYVLIAFLEGDLVDRWKWLTPQQLLDATAVGQVTPGPLFTTATFIGYLKGGLSGAVLATVGIFLPSFVMIAAGGAVFPRLRRSATAGAFLDGVNLAALALMAFVSLRLGVEAIRDPTTILIAIVSGILLIRFRVSSLWLVLGGALIGLALSPMGIPK
ncbi:MAG: chromate efflux transporter [Thermoguttaceae bacterium]|jgi:chromate transporter